MTTGSNENHPGENAQNAEIRTLRERLADSEKNREIAELERNTYKIAFQGARDAVFWADPETGILLNCNKAAEKLVKRKREDIIGKPQTFLHPKDMEKPSRELFREHISKEGDVTNETLVVTSAGEVKDVSITGSFIEVAGKRLFQGIFRNITEKKKVENKLKQTYEQMEETVERRTIEMRKNEETLRSMLLSITDHMSMMDENFKILWVNDKAKSKFGNDIVGKKCHHIYHGRDTPCKPCPAKNTFRDGKIHNHETTVVDKDDNEMYFYCTSNVALRDNEGNPMAVLEISRDITERKLASREIQEHQKGLEKEIRERKKTEKKLKESEARFRQLFNQATDAIFIIDPSDPDVVGKIVDLNQHAEKMEGYPRDELKGKSIMTLVDDSSGDEVKSRIKRIMGGEYISFIVYHRRKDGTTFPVEVSADAVIIGDRKYIMTIDRDITERKKSEEIIEKKLKLEETISRISSRYVGVFNMEDALNRTLKDVGELCGASRAYIFRFDKQKELMTNTNEWCEKGVAPQKDNLVGIPQSEFPWWVGKLKKGEAINVTDVGKLREEAAAEKSILEQQNIKSLLVLPMMSKEGPIGFIGLDNVETTAEWKKGDMAILTTTSEIITNAIEQDEAENAHRLSEEKYRTLVDNSLQAIIIYQNDVLTYVNPAAERILGYTESELLELSPGKFLSFIHSRDRQKILTNIERRLSGKPVPVKYEISVIRKDRAVRDVEMSAIPIEIHGEQAIIAFGIDITERKQSEEEMKKKLMKFKLEEGNLYLAMESSGTKSHEAFKDLSELGYQCEILSRNTKRETMETFGEEFNHYWLAEKGKKNSIPPDRKKITDFLEKRPVRTAFLLEGVEYLISRIGFESTLSIIQDMRELSYIRSFISIVSIDPGIVSKRQMAQLADECSEIEPLHKMTLSDELFHLVKYVYKQNQRGVKPTYTHIGKYLRISKPTVRKRIMTLYEKGYVVEMKRGRQKEVELSARGKNLFAR